MRRAMSRPLLALPVSISEEGMSVKDASGEVASENEDDDIDGHDPGDDPELLIETRVRLVTGLKRYLHTKHGEGLLSAASVQVLDHACDSAIDQADQPLNLWAMIEREVCGKMNVRMLSMCLFWLRRLAISGSAWHPRALWAIIRPPTVQLAELLGSALSRVMLQAIECAVEFWLALEWSPQAQWLLEASETGPLQEEVKRQSSEVWQFILDREIEAPARFQAIQTQRAAAAILRQQVAFVEELYGAGVVDGVERKALLAPIEKRERMLQRRGAVWRTPRVMDVLRNLPFLRELPGAFLDSLLSRGTMLKFDRGQVVWAPAREARKSLDSPGASAGVAPADSGGVGSIFVVMAGLVRTSFSTTGGGSQEYYLGTGSVFGLLSALVGEDLPGAGPCLAVGNALRQGPVVYEFPQPLVASIRRGAAEGDPTLQQLQLDLFRVAALYVVERLRGEVLTAAAAHFQALAIVQARHRTLCRLSRRAPPSQTHAQVWRNAGGTERARGIVAAEFKRALEAPTLDAFDDGRQAGDAPEDSANEGGPAGGTGAAAPGSGGARDGPGSRGAVAGAHDGGGLDLERALAGLGCAPGPSDRQVMASLDPQRIWQKIRSHAATALATLREDLRDAELVALAPGAPYDQETSLVLLKGTLLVTGHAKKVPPAATPSESAASALGSPLSSGLTSLLTASSAASAVTAAASRGASRALPEIATAARAASAAMPDGAAAAPGGGSTASASQGAGRAAGGRGEPVGGSLEVGVEHRGPSVVLWLWEAINGGGEVVLRPQPIRFTAGPEGAVLVACRPAADSDSDAALSEGSTHGSSDVLSAMQPLAGDLARPRALPDCGSTEADAAAPAPAPGAGSRRRMRVVSVAQRAHP